MYNTLIQFPNPAAQTPTASAIRSPDANTIQRSAQALVWDDDYSDGAAKFLTLGLVAMSHIVLLFTLFSPTPSPAIQWTAPATISVALITPELKSPSISQPAQVPPARVATKAIPLSKPEPTPIPSLDRKPSEKAISEISPSHNPVEPVSEPVKAAIPATDNSPLNSNNEKASVEPVTIPAKFNADYLHNPAPEYPIAARRRGEQGKVMLKVLVNAEGMPERVVVDQSSGFEALDKSALQAVKNWKFVPASSNNHPVSGSVIVPIRFTLDS